MIQICADEGIDLQVLAKRARAQESEWPALVHYVIVEGKKPKKRKEPVEELSQECETQENKKKKTEDTPPYSKSILHYVNRLTLINFVNYNSA